LSQGVEFQGKWVMGRHFNLAVSGTYLDSHYTSYPNASPTTLQTFEGYKAFNQTGWPTFYAPKWSGSLTGIYSTALPSGYRFIAAIEPIATSDYFNDALDLRAGAYIRLDSRLTLESPSGRWSLDVIGQNLADRDIVVFQGPQATAPGTLLEQKEQPRSVAMQIRVEW
jgi:outer membrane receptor protein involved in Fe transport